MGGECAGPGLGRPGGAQQRASNGGGSDRNLPGRGWPPADPVLQFCRGAGFQGEGRDLAVGRFLGVMAQSFSAVHLHTQADPLQPLAWHFPPNRWPLPPPARTSLALRRVPLALGQTWAGMGHETRAVTPGRRWIATSPSWAFQLYPRCRARLSSDSQAQALGDARTGSVRAQLWRGLLSSVEATSSPPPGTPMAARTTARHWVIGWPWWAAGLCCNPVERGSDGLESHQDRPSLARLLLPPSWQAP